MRARTPGPVSGPLRRTVLTALPAGLALAALAACTSGGDGSPGPTSGRRATPTPSVEEQVRLRAARTTLDLMDAVTAATTIPAKVRSAVAANHRAVLTALGATAPATGPTATGSTTGPTAGTTSGTTPSGDATDAAAGPTATARPSAASVVTGERAAVDEALADLGRVGRELAATLVRVAAIRAAHADVVARATDGTVPSAVRTPTAGTTTSGTTATTSPGATSGAGSAAAPVTGSPTGPVQPGALPTLTPTPTASLPDADLDALGRLVEAQHAAVFGYAVVVPRVSAGRRPRAQALWDEHRRDRDAAETLVVAAGRTPPAAQPAYAVDVPSSATAAGRLAADLEAGVARVATWSAGRGSGEVRSLAAVTAVTATRRSAEWLGAVPAFAPTG